MLENINFSMFKCEDFLLFHGLLIINSVCLGTKFICCLFCGSNCEWIKKKNYVIYTFLSMLSSLKLTESCKKSYQAGQKIGSKKKCLLECYIKLYTFPLISIGCFFLHESVENKNV